MRILKSFLKLEYWLPIHYKNIFYKPTNLHLSFSNLSIDFKNQMSRVVTTVASLTLLLLALWSSDKKH